MTLSFISTWYLEPNSNLCPPNGSIVHQYQLLFLKNCLFLIYNIPSLARTIFALFFAISFSVALL